MSRLLLLSMLFAIACKDDAPSDDSIADDSTPTDDSAPVTDNDGDGVPADEDCDDNNAAIFPGADELCNGVDDNCDDVIDDDAIDQTAWYTDADHDSHGDPSASTLSCDPIDGASELGDDCDDNNDAVYPGAAERCDGLDNNCNDQIDEDVQSTWYEDSDRDGHGDPGATIDDCDPPEGYAPAGDDCDDDTSTTYPGAPETCNGVDDDCNGTVDDNATDDATWYQDLDGDGFGDDNFTLSACEQPTGYASEGGDCDDNTNTSYPDAIERCNGVDDDCDGDTDEEASDAALWYADSDNDGYGDPNNATASCEAPSGTVSDDTDCDDGAADVSPGAAERCNGLDDDCNNLIDEAGAIDASDWYDDLDGDGYGDPNTVTPACDAPSGTVADNTDCDDGEVSIHPGATEVCNGDDDDCDTLVDDDDGDLDASTGTTYYLDSDNDTYGDPSFSTMACSRPSGYRRSDADCDDGDAAVNPAATELCNGVDDDCNLVIDDGLLGTGNACPGIDCLDILTADPSASDGLYWIDTNSGPAELECDMTNDGGGWTLVFYDDFESTPDAGWSLQSTYACGTFSTILGGYNIIANGEISNAVSTLGITHTEARLGMNYVKLDSWDGETAYVQIDGSTVWSASLVYYSGSEVCGWNRGYEGSYDDIEEVSAIANHSAASLTVLAGSTLNQDPGDESFGIDEVEVWVR